MAAMRRGNKSGVEQSGEFFADGRPPQLGEGLRAITPDYTADTHPLEMSDDGGRARCRHLCNVEMEPLIGGDDAIVQMARLQGNGEAREITQRVLVSDFVKLDGSWLIENLQFS